MSVSAFLQRQATHIRRGGRPTFYRKARKAFRLAFAPLVYALAVPAVVLIRSIRPWLLIRIGGLRSLNLGHFAADTELYLCERRAGINQPGRLHLDFFYMPEPICNRQLALMWKRVLRVWPEWVLGPILQVDRLIPGNPIPRCGASTQGDRDVHNLLDRIAPHLEFTPEEEARGTAGLRAMGVSHGRQYVCLNVRDIAWNALEAGAAPSSFDNDQTFRDCDAQNFIAAAEALAERGYAVIRVGAVVREAIKTSHAGVIDYATNGMRNDFMDIYLGAKCEFCVSVGSGFDAVPMIFRRPIAYVNFVPLGQLDTHSAKILGITKHHFLATRNEELSLAEIFDCGAGFFYETSDYRAGGIRLVENTPEEIRDLALEMAERLRGTWRPHADDAALQERYWKIVPVNAPQNMPEYASAGPWHGEIRARFGAAFLRENRAWLK